MVLFLGRRKPWSAGIYKYTCRGWSGDHICWFQKKPRYRRSELRGMLIFDDAGLSFPGGYESINVSRET